jgi:hypothetical protein
MGKFKGIVCAAAIAALGTTGTACWDDDEDVVEVNGTFEVIDTNDDGVVSVTEWNAAFVAWDINGDGYISTSEYLLPDGFTALDVDGNGLISQAEWDGAWALWDVSGDGFFYPYELFF